MDTQLLKDLCSIHAPSGNEAPVKAFLLDYIEKNKSRWRKEPVIIADKNEVQDCLILLFGEPRTALFAHMDSVGFTVRNDQELVRVGSPRTEDAYRLVGEDARGPVKCTLRVEEEKETEGKGRKTLKYESDRPIEKGTNLTFAPDFREDEDHVQCCYMDNRLGMWNALKVAEDLEHGAIVFSCWEEVGGGSVGYLARLLFEQHAVRQALISDITWVTNDILAGEGAAISIRDSGIPRRGFVNKILEHARESKITFQEEVEEAGGSDGIALQHSPYPFDWCFIGAPEQHVHSPDEKVHKKDIASMTALYRYLMERL